MLRLTNLLTIFFLSLWTGFCIMSFYNSTFGELTEFKDIGRFLGIMGLGQLALIVYNLVELWKERHND
ncbi:membrane protein [Bacillus phage Anthos]|uniref:Membrane protein n=1 Tax=Bacillus phage Anthos TaxID=2796502 RepID=A0A7U3TTE7_9CAUD|nr:membrane protein [Bacillus phage Anthos]